jgi:hypothetical protein
MSPVATPAVSQPSFIKMEDRKRSAAQDDFAPPTKRQAVNGSKTSADSDLPWAKDLEVSQCHTTSKHIPSFSPSFIKSSFQAPSLLDDRIARISRCFSTISMAGANAQLTIDSMPSLQTLSSRCYTYHYISFPYLTPASLNLSPNSAGFEYYMLTDRVPELPKGCDISSDAGI